MPVVRQTIYSTHDGNTVLQQIVYWKAYKDRKRRQKLQEYEAKQNEQPMQEVGIVGGKPFLSPAEAATL